MWYRLKDKIVFSEEPIQDYVKVHKKLLHVLELGDILNIYDQDVTEFYKAEIFCINDEDYNWGVVNYDGDDHYCIESLLYGLYENVEVKGVILNNVIRQNLSPLDTSLGD